MLRVVRRAMVRSRRATETRRPHPSGRRAEAPAIRRGAGGRGSGSRILLLAPHPFFSQRGSPIAERALLRVLSGSGYRVDVLTYPGGDAPGLPGVRIHRAAGIPGVEDVRPGFSWKKVLTDVPFAARALSLTGRRSYDVLHAVEESVFVARWIRRLRGIPYVYDMDSLLSRQMLESHPWMRPIRGFLQRRERAAMRDSLGVLCMCPALRELARGHVPDDCPVGVLEDTTLLRGRDGDGEVDERISEVVGAEGPIVLYVGNLADYQGIEMLVPAFRHAVDRVPDARLVIIGGREDRIETLRELAVRQGVADRAHFLGPRPLERLGHYLRQATVLVSPRTSGRNTPLKLYSYLDSEVPVLATRMRSHTQVLDSAVACLAEPAPRPFGDALARLLSDRERRERLAARAKDLVDREYSPSAFRRKLLAFYDRVGNRLRGERS